MHSERILQLLAKKMGQSATEQELLELQELMQRYPEHHLLLEVLQSIEEEKIHKEPAMSEEKLVDESWSKLQFEMNSGNQPLSEMYTPVPVRKMRNRTWMRAATWGGLILLAASATFYWMRPSKNAEGPLAETLNKVAIPYGVPEKRILPDSTEVWLNAGSSIRYSADFIQQNREVYLDGEAFFVVKHDPEHPFIVYAGNIAVRALGTQFNVHAYSDEKKIETTLISGKVQVTMTDKPDQRIILEPNEKLTVTSRLSREVVKKDEPKNEVSFQIQEVTPLPAVITMAEVAWTQDKLAFHNEPFSELAKRMERRFNKRIIFRDSTLQNERLNGEFVNENIEKAMGLLQMTTPFRYRFKGDSVFLSK